MTETKSRTKKKVEPEDESRQRNLEGFHEIRRRARESGPTEIRQPKPFVLGPEHGFDPPIAVAFPTTLVALDNLDYALRAGNTLELLRVLLGSEYRRLLSVLDALAVEYEETSLNLLTGLSLMIQSHFFGPGAGEVPGGSQAS